MSGSSGMGIGCTWGRDLATWRRVGRSLGLKPPSCFWSLRGAESAALPRHCTLLAHHCGLLADLLQNRPGGCGGVGGFGDGAADNDVAGAGGADARGYDGEVGSQIGAQSGGFAGGGDDALASAVEGERSEAQDFL